MTTPLIVCGSAHPSFGAALAREFEGGGASMLERFPDGELQIEVGAVQGRDVFVVQPLVAPIGELLLELTLLVDACHRTEARSVSAVIPYLGYARQERRTREGQPLGAEVVARQLSASRCARIIAIDLHAAAVEGFFSCTVDHLSAVSRLADAVAAAAIKDGVVVSPDLGAVKLARRFASRLNLPTAVVQKTRLSGSEVTAGEVIGEVRGRRPILVDDMISTGGTIAAAARAVLAAGAIPEIAVAATHGLLVGPAVDRLLALPIKRLLVTDSVPVPRSGLPAEIVPVVPLVAAAIRRIAAGKPLGELVAAG